MSAVTVGGIVYNQQQNAAIQDMIRYLNSGETLPYILQGYAGTGKTTLVRELMDKAGIPLNRIALVAPTNRAAKVLANKTGLHTMTIHRLIYLTVREELDFQRERLHMWTSASSFTEIADLVIEANDVDVEELWLEHLYELDDAAPAKDTPEYDEAYKIWRDEHRILTLKYEGVVLPDDPGERLRYFEQIKEERIQEHKKSIRALLDEDLKVRKRMPEDVTDKYDLIIVDEASMVSESIGNDLASYHVPIILVGDPFQLKPVKAKAFWHNRRANSVLTKIERQKGPGAGIPLAGERLRLGEDICANDSLSIHRRGTLTADEWLACDQILVGTHKTRERMCRYMRGLLGYTTPHPQVGEKIVSCYNDKVKGIMNGELYIVTKSTVKDSKVCRVDIQDPYGKTIPDVDIWIDGLEGRSKTDFLPDFNGKFWWGYAITVHQSQGSEWKHVVVCDDWFNDDHDKWLYTGITRASVKCEVIR